MLTRRDIDERASAMVAAIAIMVIVGFIIVAVMINGFSSRDNSKAALDRSATESLAREAGTTLTTIYSSVDSGEFDQFVPSLAVLQRHVTSTGATLEANPASLGAVDGSIPAGSQRSVCRSLGDARTGCWQLFAVQTPRWGTTRAGSVTVYVRAWTRATSDGTIMGDPMMYRLDVRPTWISDYQMVADGKMVFGGGATINGRVHSNGRGGSMFNQYETQFSAPVTLGYKGSVTCTGTARVSAAVGAPALPNAPTCAGRTYKDTGQDVNLLRAQALARRIRAVIATGSHPNLDMASFDNASGPIDVSLNGSSITVSGGGVAGRTLNAAAGGGQNGAVVIASGDANVHGQLGANSRALVVAMSDAANDSFSDGSAPSITITSTGRFGANQGDVTSSLGLVAQGDIIVPSTRAGGCGIDASGAFTTMSGAISIDRRLRVPFQVTDSKDTSAWCPENATFRGSIAGHFPPQLAVAINNAGFANRYYTYAPALFDNPPPMYPTAFDWQVTKFAPADLRCFDQAGVLNKDPSSGCVA